ncbi:MAG TPA: hypothetical protein PKW59_14005, partial [Thermotogota bacterium]|nr:hypothetical protein [Thermotogota bacterium]
LMDFSNFVKNYQKTHPGEGADSPDNPPGNIDHDSLSSQQIRFKWEDRCSNEIEYFITRQVQGHSDEKYTCPPNTEGATITVIPNRDNFLTLTMRTTTSGYSFVSDPLLIHPVESQTEEEIRFSYDGQEVSLNPELLPEGVLVSFSVAPETGNIITEFVFDTEGMEEALNGGREETEIKGFHAFYSIPIHYTPKSADVDAVHVTVQQEYDWWEIFNPYKTLIRLLYPNTYAADYRLLSDNKGRTFFYFGNIKNLFEALLLGTFDLTDSFINKLLSNFSPKRVKVKYEPVTNKYPSISEIIDYKALHWWVNFGNDPDPFTNDKAIIYVHGLGRNAYSTGVIDYWRAFFETEVADFDLDDYDKFAYWYDTQVYSAKEYGEKLSEFLINNGFLDHYSQIHIISHSMGTIVTRYAMNHNGLGDYITNAFLLNGVLEGSYLANITDYVLDLATNIKTNTPRVMIRDYELAARFLELVKLLIEANEIDNLVDWVKITAFGNLLYELCASAPGVACDFLINGGYILDIGFQPNPGGKSIRYANETFLNRLGGQFIGDVFEHDEDLKVLNENDQYKDKYTIISSSIQTGAEYPEGRHQFGLRAFGVVMRQIAGDIQGGVHLLNDGMVPLWSQKMQGHNAGMNEDQFWHYENLDHEEIKQNPQTIKDIYRKIANSPNPGEVILVEGGSFQMGDEVGDLDT